MNDFRYLNYAQNNRAEWAAKGEEIVKTMVAKCSSLGSQGLECVPEQEQPLAEQARSAKLVTELEV